MGDIKGGGGGRRRRGGWPSARQGPVRRRRCATGLGGGESGTAKAEGRGPRCRVWGGERRGRAGTESLGLGRKEDGTGAFDEGLLGLVVFVDAGGQFVGLGCTLYTWGATGLTARFSLQLVNELALDYSQRVLKKRSILSP